MVDLINVQLQRGLLGEISFWGVVVVLAAYGSIVFIVATPGGRPRAALLGAGFVAMGVLHMGKVLNVVGASTLAAAQVSSWALLPALFGFLLWHSDREAAQLGVSDRNRKEVMALLVLGAVNLAGYGLGLPTPRGSIGVILLVNMASAALIALRCARLNWRLRAVVPARPGS
jgi:hypothetical protein